MVCDFCFKNGSEAVCKKCTQTIICQHNLHSSHTYYIGHRELRLRKKVACPPKVVPSVKLVFVQTERNKEYDT